MSNDTLTYKLSEFLDDKLCGLPLIQYMFSEDQGRYIVSVSRENLERFIELTISLDILSSNIGITKKSHEEVASLA